MEAFVPGSPYSCSITNGEQTWELTFFDHFQHGYVVDIAEVWPAIKKTAEVARRPALVRDHWRENIPDDEYHELTQDTNATGESAFLLTPYQVHLALLHCGRTAIEKREALLKSFATPLNRLQTGMTSPSAWVALFTSYSGQKQRLLDTLVATFNTTSTLATLKRRLLNGLLRGSKSQTTQPFKELMQPVLGGEGEDMHLKTAERPPENLRKPFEDERERRIQGLHQAVQVTADPAEQDMPSKQEPTTQSMQLLLECYLMRHISVLKKVVHEGTTNFRWDDLTLPRIARMHTLTPLSRLLCMLSVCSLCAARS